jgi:hypothetical protein
MLEAVQFLVHEILSSSVQVAAADTGWIESPVGIEIPSTEHIHAVTML